MTIAAIRLVLLCALLAPALAHADAATLRAKYDASRAALRDNPYERPLLIESTDVSGSLRGDVYAVLEHPYATVQPALTDLSHWCEILILPFNVKQCAVEGRQLALNVGRKFDQPLAKTYRVAFDYSVVQSNADYLDVQLHADSGPVGTHDYLINFEAVPLDAQRSFIHFAYSYGYGFSGKVALNTYLTTTGRNKVGFSKTGAGYTKGTRGVVERNAMRYYLAIDAYLVSLAAAKPEQPERAMQRWFAGTEQYAQQLHEMERAEYLKMKRAEYARMHSVGTERAVAQP